MQSEVTMRFGAPMRAWRALGVLLLLYIFAFIDRQIISLLVQPIKADLGLSDMQIGMLQGAAFAVFFAIGGVALGWLVDRTSRRWIIYCGITAWSLASAGCGLATSFGMLFLGRVAVGVGEAALTPAAYSLLHDIFPRQRLATALAIFHAGATVGAGVAFALGGALIGLLPADGVATPWGPIASWRAAFLITGLPGVLLALLVFTVPEPARARMRQAAVGARVSLAGFAAANWRILGAHFLGFPLMALCAVSLIAWGPTLFMRRFGWEAHQTGIVFGLMIGVFGSCGNILGGVVVDRLFRRGLRDAHFRVPLTCVLIGLPLYVGGALAPNPWLAMGMLTLGFMTSTSYAGPGASSLQLIAPAGLRGQISALYVVVIALIGTGVGPMAVGAVTDLVLRDEARLGASLAIVFGTAGLITATTLLVGRKPMRAALEASEARGAESAGEGGGRA